MIDVVSTLEMALKMSSTFYLRQSTAFYSNLRHPTASYGILRHSTAFTAFYSILRHSTARYGILRHSTAFYGMSTAFYGMSTAFYGILRHVYGILRHKRLRRPRGFFETFVPIWLLLTHTIMSIEDWLAQVHGILQGNADCFKSSLVFGNAMPEQSTKVVIKLC
jgi:hypothetical protein